jgi:hypothetical protein
VRRFLAVLVFATLGGAVAVVAVKELAPSNKIVHADKPQPPVIETEVVPAAGQAIVSGTVQSFNADDAVGQPIPTPLTINAVERGARSNARIEGALVGGTRKTLYWDAGTPLPINGPSGGALDLGPAHVDVDGHGVTWTLTGAARSFNSGKYHIGSPIAIGTGGLATSHDEGADFTADDHTVLTATKGVVVHFDSPALQVDGPGQLTMTGHLTVRTSAGSQVVSSITFGPGPFRVALKPGTGGVEVTATLQGPVKTA